MAPALYTALELQLMVEHKTPKNGRQIKETFYIVGFLPGGIQPVWQMVRLSPPFPSSADLPTYLADAVWFFWESY